MSIFTTNNNTQLTIVSLRDIEKNTSSSTSLGMSAGGSGVSGANGSMSVSKSTNKTVVESSFISNDATINVDGITNLEGATLATGTYNEDGTFTQNDNLKLTTTDITSKDLSNVSYSKGNSIGGGISFSEKNKTDDNGKVIKGTNGKAEQDTSLSQVDFNLSNDMSYNKTKTLATLGTGTITLTGKDATIDETLNRDATNTNKEIFSTESGVEIDVSVDTRLLTEDGRKEIKDDIITSSAITNAIEQIATTDKAGLLDFFTETQKNVDVYEGMKIELANNPELVSQLENSDLTPQEKQAMLQTVRNTVAESLGYDTNEVNLVSTDSTGSNDTEFKGNYNQGNKETYINDKNNDSTSDLIATLGHETQHNIDHQTGELILNDTDQNNYADNFGEDLSFYTSNALDQTNGGTLANTNTHNQGQTTTNPSVFNDNTFTNNNAEYDGVDKSLGDNDDYEKLYYENKIFSTNTAQPEWMNVTGRGIDNVSKAINGGVKGVDKLMLIDRPNDPMFNMLRYKVLEKSSTNKILDIQPSVSELAD